MRCLGVVLCSLLLAGLSAATVSSAAVNEGEEFIFNVVAPYQLDVVCTLITPNNVPLIFKHGETSTNGDRYELEDWNEIRPCAVILKSVQTSDQGVWKISSENQNRAVEQSFDLTVTPSSNAPTDIEDDIKWLNPIEFPTRTGQSIDLSLSKSEFAEDCYIRPPAGESINTADANIEGVKIHGSSEFVSCRVTIGPMDETLIGDWVICAKRTENNEDRCQLTRIAWNSNSNPGSVWDVENLSEFDHAVHLGGTLNPVVQDIGSHVTCHIITPDGEDLVIEADSDYPNLKLVSTSDDICSIAIGPLTNHMLGNWTLYGKFKSIFGLREIRLPMNLFLYDEDNPYDQAYNVTMLTPITRTVNMGTILEVEVSSLGKVDQCQIETPSGDLVNSHEGASFVKVENSVACRLAIGPITEKLLGSWTVIGKFSYNNRFTEIRQIYELIQEDPANPIIDEDRRIEILNAQHVSSDIGSSQNIFIGSEAFVTGESCHVRTPDGMQYEIMDGFSIPGVSVIEESDVECGVVVEVLSEDAVGTWTLIARATRFSQQIERRLPFTINVEETVEAVPKEITVVEGNALFIRLANPTDQYDTCQLYAQNGSLSLHAVDPQNLEHCGFIITNVSLTDKGTWEIVYGDRKIHRAQIVVDIVSADLDTAFSANINLIRDRNVNLTVGPENAVYCRLVDPKGFTVFDGFGQCTLVLDRVTLDHQGAWQMTVASVGRVVAVEQQLYVNVSESESKPAVTTNVVTAKPTVTVSCSVAVDATIRACKFRDPQGKILLANGVTESRYVSRGVQTSNTATGNLQHECSLSITEPVTQDLGLWRCALETEEDTYYGFMPVLCPWAMQVPEIAAVVQQVPILKAHRTEVDAIEDEPVTMSCAVEAAIKYCYFRFQNGTTFSVSPGMSSQDMEYVGAGFEAGECGVRFHSTRHRDSGRWSCHVGLENDPEEQRSDLHLSVQEAMRVDHRWDDPTMVVGGIVAGARALEYCRFVRIDGFGFATGNFPSNYVDSSSITHGVCQLTVTNPTIVDLHPWTVVAKVRGQDAEISKDTMDSLVLQMPSPHPGPEDEHDHGIVHVRNNSAFVVVTYVFMAVVLVGLFLGLWLGPRRNREWTSARVSAIRSSFHRTSIKKEPLPPQAPPSYEQNV